MTEQEIKNIIAQGEGQKTEFKLNFGSKALVAINALENTEGGFVLIGVSNKGEVVGVDLNSESVQEWLNEIKQKTEPSVSLLPQKLAFQIKQ